MRRAEVVVLVRTLAAGIHGTDEEILSGRYATAEDARLIIGHVVLDFAH